MVFGVQEVLIVQENYTIWQRVGLYTQYFCIECNVCNLSMNLIGEILCDMDCN